MASFLSGMLGPALTATSQAVAGKQGGEIQGYLMKRQQDEKDQERWLKEFIAKNNARNIDSEIFAREHPKPSVKFDSVSGRLINETQGTSQPVEGIAPQDPVKKAVEIASATKGIPTYGDLHPRDHFTFTPGTDADGNPVIARGNTNTGEVEPTTVGRPQGQGGGGGNAQNMQARLLGAVSEGRLADERMSQFEQKHLKNGQLDIGTMKGMAGGLATDLVGSHNPINILLQRGAEGTLGGQDADYLQYMRDARLISRAEQLMSARGGSEAMAQDNAFLARGGANASERTVRAAQKSRKALFGKLGAVMQTLSPAQTAKLQKGLEALHNDDANFDYVGLGKEIVGVPDPGGDIHLGKPSKIPSPAQRQRASTDHEYKDFLLEQGYKF